MEIDNEPAPHTIPQEEVKAINYQLRDQKKSKYQMEKAEKKHEKETNLQNRHKVPKTGGQKYSYLPIKLI